MALSEDMADCMQAWWVEAAFLLSFALGWALLRGKWRLVGAAQPVVEDGLEVDEISKKEAIRRLPGDADAMHELLRFLRQDLQALSQASLEARAGELFQRARRPGVRVDEALCGQLLEASSQARLPSLVREVASLARSQHKLSASLCQSLMRAYVATGLLGEAQAVYGEASERCLTLDEEVDDLYDEILAKDAMKPNL
mmetsp:Transcript_130363/g.405529  ORF Transcript_130363/g.405529 Transcript_130363/m.405529 type:complete len:198 (+) Transcript_130363:139-732(+)|eukprot:CAMPEP_0204579872 /NCGR_PEP_ID=MMETSP0661-20131031/43744_1 /ASSEMBLY_ACC=CAM_ASM_000606 /TAXON_ID=109239 /ORGANISM="Alexandrium margalefi, Strain AMGDE01CS-322" /LENGTH=197 /DNA_ID=CAMNT_0051588919 /DNA_START=139 /DNA_END=732 /DNA_ORIENTATION=-